MRVKNRYSRSANDLAEEELVANMIHNFVLPEVEKHNARKKIRDQQQSYIRNAHIAIYEKILDLPSVESSRATTDREVWVRNEEEQDVRRAICVDDDNTVIVDDSFSCRIIFIKKI